MKSLKLVLGLALGTTGLGGVVTYGVANSIAENKVQVAEAANTKLVRCTYPDGWSGALKCHYWGGSSETQWPGIGETGNYKNSFNQTVVVFTIPSDTTYVIFNNNNNGKQTVNIQIGSNQAWYTNGTLTDGKYNVQSFNPIDKTFYLYDYNASFSDVTTHIWNSDMGIDFDTWPGTHRTADSSSSGRIYTIVTDQMANKVIFSDNGSSQTGNLSITANYAYKLDENQWWDNIKYVRAHDWAQNVMHMRDYDPSKSGKGDGSCTTYYPIAKQKYDTFDEYVINEINNGFADAVTRFNTWASLMPKSSQANMMLGITQNNTAIIVTALTSSVAIVISGLYFFLRKRKHQ